MGAIDRDALIRAAQLLLDEVAPQVHHAGRVCADERAEAIAALAQEALDGMQDGLDQARQNMEEELNLTEIRVHVARIKAVLPPLPPPKPHTTQLSMGQRAKAAVAKTIAETATAVVERTNSRAKAAILGWLVVGRQGEHDSSDIGPLYGPTKRASSIAIQNVSPREPTADERGATARRVFRLSATHFWSLVAFLDLLDKNS